MVLWYTVLLFIYELTIISKVMNKECRPLFERYQLLKLYKQSLDFEIITRTCGEMNSVESSTHR